MYIAALLTTMGYLATTVVAVSIYTEADGYSYPSDGFLVNPNNGQKSGCTANVYCGRFNQSPPDSKEFTIYRDLCDPFYHPGQDRNGKPLEAVEIPCNARNTGKPGLIISSLKEKV
ncbi:hypothetical protein HYFRA_00008336 [Hymenoscyphus fraxineus]|uniref:Uncharacterized protein n=1 Tax=Hymenoscyphus fraxineus TaxID=746836 RepID=A0A9N9KQB7_9HELO|nr:hypothetical protein HYFRA_00008336 [Hymenoscyphus fraxineus]